MSYYAHGFEGEVATLDYGVYQYTVIYLPASLEAALPFDSHPRLRIEGEIAEHPFNGALIPSRQGRHLIVSPEVLRATGLRLGAPVEVRFNIADQDAVAIPDELQWALDADARAQAAWDALTPGRRRGLAHLVGKPKTLETRQRKAAELADALATGAELPGPPARRARRTRPDA